MATLRPNYQPILDTRQNRLSFELSRSDGIDSKALSMLGANIAVLIYIAQAGLQMSDWKWFVLLVPFGLSSFMNVMQVLFYAPYRGNVSMTDHPEYLSMDEEDLLLQLIADTESAIVEGADLNARRLKWFAASVILSIIGVSILAIML